MPPRNGHKPRDLTVEILKEIRDEMRGMRAAQDGMRAAQDETNARLGIVETTLRDLAEQMMVLGRAVKVSIEHRKGTDRALSGHERRIERLEKRLG
jgi:hypothetical protein